MQLAIEFDDQVKKAKTAVKTSSTTKVPQSAILDGLNERQIEAVAHKNGPLLIIAGAGTGKTTVVTKRIAYLVEQGWAKPSEILALTFTEKAAAEMEERVDQLVPYGCTDMWIGTFHAFADRLLRDYSIDLGLPADFKILTGTQQAIFLRQNLYKLELKYYRPLSNPTTHIAALLNHFSRLKDELISPEQYIAFGERRKAKGESGELNDEERIEIEKTLELAKAYLRYQELMTESGNLDFGDLIYKSYELLRTNKKVLNECQEKFKFIMVDEYQDTNFAQNEIIKLLSSKEKNITVVGDDDQSIYRFRGASISNILDFKQTYPNAREVVLVNNYRSTQEILDASYVLIQHNNPDRLEVKNNINKRLIAISHGPMPDLIHTETLSLEADAVAKKIVEIKTERDFAFKDFAILVRANSHVEPFIQALNLAGVPYAYSGNSSLFDQSEVKNLIALIKILVYIDDSLSFYRLATSEFYNISPGIIAELFSTFRRTNRSMYALLEHQVNTNYEIDEKLSLFYSDLIKYRELSKSKNTGELLYQYLSDKDYFKRLSNDPTPENELKLKNVSKFFDRISQFNQSAEDLSLISFLSNLELMIEYGDETAIGDADPTIDAVNIMTAHGAKGLEWKVVFVANMVADRFPSRRKREQIPLPDELIKEHLPEGDFHIEEERRLFYVACTRAKETLYFTSADDYGGKRKKKVSPFVFEALPDLTVLQTSSKLSEIEKIQRFQKSETLIVRLPYKFTQIPMKLSRLQIDDYITCPHKFYLAHVLQIPLLENQALIYGTAIHAALGYYYNAKIRGEQVKLSDVIEHFHGAFKGIGFESLEHEQDRRNAGEATLARFYEFATTEERVPTNVELPFSFNNKSVIVNGRYDLVYANQELPEIYDFKTSNVSTQERADQEVNKSLQMRVYALSWLKKYNVIPKTTLHFIEYGLTAEKVFTPEELAETEEQIFEVTKAIQAKQFMPKPEHSTCQWCAFRDICPDAAK